MNFFQTISQAAYDFTAYLFSSQPNNDVKKQTHPITKAANLLQQGVFQQALELAHAPIQQQAKSAFEREDALLASLFSGKDAANRSIMKFANAIKSSAYRTPYTAEERKQIAIEEQTVLELLKNAQEKIQDDGIDDLPEDYQEIKDNLDKKLLELRANAEKLRQAHVKTEGINPADIELAKLRIAKLIFLADRNLETTADLINGGGSSSSASSDPAEQAAKRIEASFDREIEKIKNYIGEKHEQHSKFLHYQDPTAVVNTYTPIEIAKVLVTSQGLLNLGLVDIVKRCFIVQGSVHSSNGGLLEHQEDMETTLDDLIKYPDLAKQVESITKPNTPESNANNIIRLTLRMPPDAQPTDTHAKIVALGALLSDMRQGSVGSCFATSICILMMGTLKGKVLADFAEILSKGKMTRESTSEQSEFIPVLDIGDSTCQKPLYVMVDGSLKSRDMRSGKMSDTTLKVWESPGLLSSCRQLGIQEGKAKDLIMDAVTTLFRQNQTASTQPLTTSMEDIIEVIGEKQNATITYLSDYEKQERIDLALTAFNSETNTPLGRAYESAVASTVEGGDKGFVRSRITKCVLDCFGKQQPQPQPVANNGYYYYPSAVPTISQTATKVQEVFKRVFNGSMQIRYDEKENIEKDGSAAATTGDGHSTEAGAFVVYRKLVGKDSTQAKRVVTPEDFSAFVADTIKVTKEVLNNEASNDTDRQAYQKECDRINALVTGPNSNFLKSAITNYSPNIKDPDPVRNWKKIEEVPWRDATGNFNKPIFEKMIGVDAGDSVSLKPRNMIELLIAFINFGRDLERTTHFLENDLPDEKLMVNTDQHAFSVSVENETAAPAMRITDPLVEPKDWIKQNLLDKAIENPTAEMTRFGIKIVSDLKNYRLDKGQIANIGAIMGSMCVRPEMQPSFRSMFQQQVGSATTIFEVSQIVTRLVNQLSGSAKDSTKAYNSMLLSTILLDNVLPPTVKAEIGRNVLRFADTNWVGDDQKNIYFAGAYNPATDQIELFSVQEDGTGLRPMQQDVWVTGTNWQMFKLEITPDMATRSAVHLV